MKFIRRNIRLLFLLVIPVYLFIVHNSLQHKHTHFYPNGMVVSHSHPLNGDDSENPEDHSHTKNEICFYSSFNFDYYNITNEFQLGLNQNFLIKDYEVRSVGINDFKNLFFNKFRGPPCFQIS